jgi:hypothetical protein
MAKLASLGHISATILAVLLNRSLSTILVRTGTVSGMVHGICRSFRRMSLSQTPDRWIAHPRGAGG